MAAAIETPKGSDLSKSEINFTLKLQDKGIFHLNTTSADCMPLLKLALASQPARKGNDRIVHSL